MTREEAIEFGKTILLVADSNDDESAIEFTRIAISALEQEPCDDAISRDAVCNIVNDIRDCISVEGYWAILERLKKLPSVTQKSETVTEFADRCRECGARYGKLLKQKSGKWDRLYSWLNDMRLGIAPDETVDDIDERHCREAQTDILDEIMEWMIKAESEDKG